MNSYEQVIMDKIDELQQQARFCVNNYDYHHRNNESVILNQKRKQVRSSARYINRFWNNLNALEDAVQQVGAECDKVDVLLLKYGIGKKASERQQQREPLDGSNVEEDDAKSEKENL